LVRHYNPGDFVTVTIERRVFVAVVRAAYADEGGGGLCDIGVLATRQLFRGVPASRLVPHSPSDADRSTLASIAASAPPPQPHPQQQEQQPPTAPGAGEASPLPTWVPVQVPANATPGQVMSVVVMGRRFKFKVPDSAAPGAVIQLELATATEVIRRQRPSLVPPPAADEASSEPSTSKPEQPAAAPPRSSGPAGMDVVAGFLMDSGVDAGLAIEASARLVEAGLDSAEAILTCDLGVLGVASGLDAQSIAMFRPQRTEEEGSSGGGGRAEALNAPPHYVRIDL
jgi:hypothetical protein